MACFDQALTLEEVLTGLNQRMNCLESISTRELVCEVKGTKMADSRSKSAVSRRPARLFMEEQQVIESGNLVHTPLESRHTSGDEKDKDRPQREGRSSSISLHTGAEIPIVDLGRDVYGLFPSTVEDMGKQVIKSLQAAKTMEKAKGDGRPLNFGVVLPGTIYRSSFPMVEDFQFLSTLGLKTIVSLVKKEFSSEFLAFLKTHGISHRVIEMQGTKKVDIPQSMMQSIMEIALDKENHPLLIHCNHGKHRTGCATAVIRHVAGWHVDAIVEEYIGFATPKVRDCDVKYIKDYQVSSLRGLFGQSSRRQRIPIINEAKMGKFVLFAAIVLTIWLTTFLFWE